MRTQAISSSQFVKPGIVLMREGAQFPSPVELKGSTCYPSWNVVESTAAEIDRKVTKAGKSGSAVRLPQRQTMLTYAVKSSLVTVGGSDFCGILPPLLTFAISA